MSIPFSQGVRDLVQSMQNRVLMGSPHFSPTACTRSRWIDAELCAHGISPFFAHRNYVISLDQCRIVCSLCLLLLLLTACTLFTRLNTQICHQSLCPLPCLHIESTSCSRIDAEWCADVVWNCLVLLPSVGACLVE